MQPPNPGILIVDDEPALLKMMGVYLTRKGFNVTMMDGTDRAWAQWEARAGELAVAVLDASMRGLRAQDLALRLLTANPSLCVVMASGYPVDMTALEDAAAGRVTYVQKPFTAKALMDTLQRIIATQKENI